MARVIWKVTSAIILVIYFALPRNSSSVSTSDFEDQTKEWAYKSKAEVYFEVRGEKTFVGPTIEISHRILRTGDTLLFICRRSAFNSQSAPCRVTGNVCIASAEGSLVASQKCPGDTSNNYDCFVSYHEIKNFTEKQSGLYSCLNSKDEKFLVSWFDRTQLYATPYNKRLSADKVGSEVNIDCNARLQPSGQDYSKTFEVEWKFKGSGSNEWVPVVRNKKGIEFSPPVNGPNYTLNIAYNPVLHDGGYRCFGSFYTVGWKSENGRENGESNTATLQFESSASWKYPIMEAENDVLLTGKGGSFECLVSMYPFPDKIEIKVNGNPIGSTERITDTVNHTATVEVIDIYGTFDNGSMLSCHATNSRGSVVKDSKPIYFKPDITATTTKTATDKITTLRHDADDDDDDYDDDEHDHDDDTPEHNMKKNDSTVIIVSISCSVVIVLAVGIGTLLYKKNMFGKIGPLTRKPGKAKQKGKKSRRKGEVKENTPDGHGRRKSIIK